MISISAPEGIPEIKAGDDIADVIAIHCELQNRDVVVVTSKIVSKAEGSDIAVILRYSECAGL